ncbi:MAG TPA: hypothetical protein QGH10_01465 [Armatimonadota bacterium]|nr:hypothetical protein [Armatimonadota bacterium]
MHPALVVGLFIGTMPIPNHGKNAFEKHAIAAIRGEYGSQPEWKMDLLREALLDQKEPEPCRVSYYHPREAGRSWKRWTGTRTGTMVRPGVASCTLRNWGTWGGAWLWIENYGVCHVEDVFPESRDAKWFDLASPATAATPNYTTWLNSLERAQCARRFGKRPSTFVVLKYPGES